MSPMGPMNRRRAGLACIACLGAMQPASARAAEPERPKSAWPGGNVYERSLRSYTVPDVVLVDAAGKPVRLREVFGTADPVMLNFIFTTCSTICPVMVRVFADVPARLGKSARDLRMVSISIDPENDTPARLRSYAKEFGQGLNWQFLTGRLSDIRAVRLAFGTNAGDKMNHEPLTIIRQARGGAWLRIEGFANPDELAREYLRMASS